MPAPHTYWWTKAPALRLLPPLVAGIVLQWYLPLSLPVLLLIAGALVLAWITSRALPVSIQYFLKPFTGAVLFGLLAMAGAGLVWTHDVRNNNKWFGKSYAPNDYILATLQEPPVTKPASYKALAMVNSIVKNKEVLAASGKIIIYFKKESTTQKLHYGTQVLIHKPLQPIKNTGNPGAFDYQRYSLFQGITHQVYLTQNDFAILPAADKTVFKNFIFRSRAAIVATLQRYISGAKEQGLAEALLIGYKDDLDKTLVQAYANTGVVHIIAISGLHLGLIYLILMALTKPLRRKKLVALRVVVIIAALWLFSLLAGAQPSVLRAAVMFSALALAEVLDRRTSVFNTLALSAFVLLCINPFWLWDAGFQLSYTAVLSILIFYKPVYNWVYLPNKAMDYLWKLVAVTLAAQILTTPVSIYHFQQFPLLFLITNLLAVPLSSIILLGELVLCVFAFFEPAATFLGSVLAYLIEIMNHYVERMDTVSFAVWAHLYLTLPQTLLLLASIAAVAYWLLEQNKQALVSALTFLFLFVVLRSISFVQAQRQKKLIVYNVPRHQAIDVVDGRTFYFIGDSALQQTEALRKFHLQPSRIQHRVQPAIAKPAKAFTFYYKKVLVLDAPIQTKLQKEVIDVLVLSKNPRLYVPQLAKHFTIQQVVIDGSVPAWKAQLWKKDCAQLRIPCHDVAEKGAFVMNLQ